MSGEYYAEAANVGNTTFRPMLQMLDSSGASLGFVGAINAVTVTNSAVWTAYEGVCTINQANTATIRWYSYVNSTTLNNKVRVRNIRVQRRANGKLIVDGSVQANKITAGTYTGGEFVIGPGGILRTNASEVIITQNGITVTSAATGGISASALTTGTFATGQALTVNGNMLLNGNMQVQTGGYIKSTEYTGTTQATNPSGLGWYLGRDGLRIDSGSIAASALTAGTLGSSTGIINIGVGATIQTNGGAIKSNTFNGTFTGGTYNNDATAGYYLDSTNGLVVATGKVSASSLVTGTISGTNTITLSGANAKISGPGFDLSGTGLTVTSGTIAAAAITVTSAFANTVTSTTTTIDGGKINTGSIRSNTTTNVGGTTQWLWEIKTGGEAIFGEAYVRGKLIVGPPASTDTSYIQSGNYSPGATAGWKIQSDGNAYFNNLTLNQNASMTINAGGTIYSKFIGGYISFYNAAIYPGYITPGLVVRWISSWRSRAIPAAPCRRSVWARCWTK